jgi:prophage regulatory protein
VLYAPLNLCTFTHIFTVLNHLLNRHHQGDLALATVPKERKMLELKKVNPVKRVMNLNDVLMTLGISKSTLYRLIGAGNFPKPFKLGERLNAWRVETIEAWLNAQSANVERGI